MKRDTRRFIAAVTVFFGIVFAVFFWKENRGEVGASAVGTVSVTGGTVLNVRTGPGTGYPVLISGGTKVTISNGMTVTITAENGSWYHVKFKQNANTLTGYVSAKYIKVQTGSVVTAVYGKTNKAVKIRETATSTGKYLTVNSKNVSLVSGKKVRILSETLEGTKKWYRISVTYNNVKCKGYIPAVYVGVTVPKNGLPGIIKSTSAVSTYTDPANKKLAYQGSKKITLTNKEQVTILSELIISSKKYIYVQFTFNNKTVKAYAPSSKVFLQIVKKETIAATAAPTASSKATQAPATAPAATPQTAGMTSAEFKKSLKDAGFPDSYLAALVSLHEKYPLWSFVPYKTGLSWNTVIKNESKVGLNLLSNSKSLDWKSFEDGAYNWKTDTFIPFDGSTWVTASEKAVKYYMDPRNFLDDRGIFQFESLAYHSDIHTQDGVENILNNTPMYKKTYTYTNTAGKSVSEKYSQTFMTAAKESQVSPYHLAARVKQEVVISATLMSSSVSGNVAGYKGIYNFYNIGANNSTVAGGAVANGLKWASTGTTYLRPWKSPYLSIVGGASYIGKNYINVGQNTVYLEKFNVTSKNRYTHQYMGNVEAPNSEATKARDAYGTMKGKVPLVFSIPVYNNMPETPCEVPSGGKNPNNYLKTLAVTGYSFTSAFTLGDDGSKTYVCKVPAATASVKITATKVASSATLSGTGTKDIKSLAAGKSKTYTVKVTSESGSARSYKVKITKKSS